MPLIDVPMPQMGESITEGTITKWLKKVGDTVGKDEPLFEISTDKVDAEIPAPVSGKIAKILVEEGKTVGVHTVVAQIESAGADDGARSAASRQAVQPEPGKKVEELRTGGAKPAPDESLEQAPSETRRTTREVQDVGAPGEPEAEGERVHSSPLVRRLAKEYNVDLKNVEGTGPGGRITKEDLLAYVERQKSGPVGAAAPPSLGQPAPQPPDTDTRIEIVPMSPMRKKIAERMVASRHTAAHVSTVFQIDLSKITSIYQRERERFERQEGTKLTYTPFFVRGVIDGIKKFPILNSSVSGESIIYKKDVHMGIAVALDWGLIVPVVRHADEKSFLGLTRAINDLAERARNKKLAVNEVEGGTFTITNPGAYGGLFATPIINPPQVGIVGVGGIHKMPVVIDDAIAIRPIVHLTLSYDHRVIDGAVADQFMAAVKNYLEHWEEDILG